MYMDLFKCKIQPQTTAEKSNLPLSQATILLVVHAYDMPNHVPIMFSCPRLTICPGSQYIY